MRGHGQRRRTARSSAAPALLLALGLALVAGKAFTQEAIDVTLSRAGVNPDTLRLRKGETVRLTLKTADEEHCFAVDALRVEKRVQPGRVTILDLTPDKAGSFPVYCCLEPENAALRGRLIVAE